MWVIDATGQRLFSRGLGNWAAAAAVAADCLSFRADDEDEQCADDEQSCYNCRYRRWTTDSFVCLALSLRHEPRNSGLSDERVGA